MKTLLLLLVLGRGADATTSLIAFHGGATERNPLVVSTQPVIFTTQMALETGGEVWLLRRLAVQHQKWATTLALVQIGASVTAASLNARDLHRQGRH